MIRIIRLREQQKLHVLNVHFQHASRAQPNAFAEVHSFRLILNIP